MGKSGGFPTSDQIEAAKAEGFVPPTERGRSFDQYEEQTSSGPDFSGLIVWGVVGLMVLVLLAVAATILIVVAQRRKNGKVS